MSATTTQSREAADGFDAATTLTRAPGGASTAEISHEYGGFGGAHGGYVAALALRALTELVDDPARHPRSLSIQLLAPVRPGRLDLQASRSRAGRSMAAGAVSLQQDGDVVAMALGAFGATAPSLARRDVVMPDVPPPAECEVVVLTPPGAGSFKYQVEHRAAAPPLPLSGSSQARLAVWMRLTEDRPLDVFSATMLADGAPPALFGTLTEFAPIPSTDITLHYSPAIATTTSAWVLGVFASRDAGDGYNVEDGELWSPAGELLLHSRQLRRLL